MINGLLKYLQPRMYTIDSTDIGKLSATNTATDLDAIQAQVCHIRDDLCTAFKI